MSEKQLSINDWEKDENLRLISRQLLLISQGTSTVIGERFFENLAQCLAAAFHVRYAFIGKVINSENNIAQMSPLWDEVEKEFNNSIVWNLKNTPCEDVVLRETRLVPKNVQKAYPLAPILKKYNIESYFGIPLISSSGKRLGLISVMDDKPMTDLNNYEPIIQIFADRCVCEMERLEIDSKLKEASISKNRSEDYLSAIANNTISVIYMKDLEGRYLLINKRWENIFNVTNQEVQGKTDFDLFPKEIAEKFVEHDNRVIKSGKPFEGEEVAPLKDGLHTYFSVKVPLKRPNGEIYGICGVSTDVTERDILFKKLKRSEEKFKSYFDLPLIGIAITSPEKGWLEVNQKLCDILGYNREELTLMTWTELTYPDDLEEDVFQFNRVLAGEIDGYSIDKRFIRKDKVVVSAKISARCIRKADGKIDYFVALIEDISLRKKFEKEVDDRNLELIKSNEELERFTFTASHDLVEPLRKVITFGDLLKEACVDKLEEEELIYIKKMQKASFRMKSLVDDLLIYTKLDKNKESFEILDLNIIIQEVLEDLEVQIVETKGSVQTHPLPKIEAEKIQMRQLFQNLIGNGLKYIRPNVPPKIVVKSVPYDNGFCEILIEDNGVGFLEKYAEKIFEPFQRLNSSSDVQGSGMGLFICEKIMLRHNGTISVKSKPDEGSIFIIRLPMKQPTSS